MTSSGTRDHVAGGRRAVRSVRRLFEPPSYLRGGRVLWASAGLSLVFGLLMLPYAFVVIGDLAPDRRAWAQGIGIAYVAFSLLFVALGETRSWIARMSMCVTLLALGAALVLFMGLQNAWVLVFALCVIIAFTRTAFAGSVVVVVVAALAVAAFTTGVIGETLSELLLLSSVGVAMILFIRLVEANAELRRARDRIAAFAVVEERERFARDLHDILGHSLTTITVKTGLLRRILEKSGREAEAAEAREVELIARQALADVRGTVSGYRVTTLAGELAAAGTVLRSAGIEGRLPQAVDDVHPEARELFGYVVREGITNAVRHSGARELEVRLGRDWVVVKDDGPGRGPIRKGNGLRGLEERMAEKGGTLSVGRGPDGGFLLRAELPAAHDDGAKDEDTR
ncbi:sensor histidine kinase [Nocardiopsis alba]|uniref:sensor histidine kinase n=1 Tax=Nocardiopsis alba TaxID=53437 RepID=UPI001F4CC925|nr:histidine kinase [Nocardiopsis alba]